MDLTDIDAASRTAATEEAVAPPDGDTMTASITTSPVDATARRRLQDVPVGLWFVLAMVALYTWHFTRETLDIHHGLGTAAYDSGLFDQGIWLMSRFETPFVTLMGRNLMGDHTSFVLVLLVPFYWLFPAAGTMFFFQALAIGAGAIPVYLYARNRLGREWSAVVFAAVYLLHPAVSWTNMENFHPDAFLGVFVGFALYGALERRWRVYTVFVVLALLVKEDVSLVIVPLGVWVAIYRDRRTGILTILGSVAFMAFAMFVVMRSLIGVPTRNGWRIPFGGVGGFIETALRNPTQVADHFRAEGRPWYVWQMTSPVAFQFLRNRRWQVAAISGLVLFTNVLSTFWYQFHIQYHYSLVVVPAIVFGSVYALGTVPETGRWNRDVSVAVVGLAAVAAAYTWAPLPFAVHEVGHWSSDHPVAVAARDILADVPDDASVSAQYRIAAHLTHRTEIYQFPNPFRVVLYGPDISWENTRLQARADRVEYLVLQVEQSEENARDFEQIRDAFVLVRANEFWELWKRNPDVELPPLVLP